MSATYAEPLPTSDSVSSSDEGALQYRALYSGALIAALFGLASLFMLAVTDFIDIAVAVSMVPIVGIIMSLMAIRKIRKNSDIYTGMVFAQFGLGLSAAMLFYGLGSAAYKHATEVPDGYERISFATLQPSEKDKVAGRPVPKPVFEMLTQQTPVFIKGYIRPGSSDSRTGATQFLLVRDNNTCCFGDLSKVQYFDQILVTLDRGITTDTDLSVTRVGGQLLVNPMNLGRGPEYPVYELRADHIE